MSQSLRRKEAKEVTPSSPLPRKATPSRNEPQDQSTWPPAALNIRRGMMRLKRHRFPLGPAGSVDVRVQVLPSTVHCNHTKQATKNRLPEGGRSRLPSQNRSISLRTRSMVGIELRRASCRWRVTKPALSIASWVLIFHHGYVFEGPPIMPDGRISQVRFEVLASRL